MDGGAPGRGMDAPRPSPYLAQSISSSVPELNPVIISHWPSK